MRDFVKSIEGAEKAKVLKAAYEINRHERRKNEKIARKSKARKIETVNR